VGILFVNHFVDTKFDLLCHHAIHVGGAGVTPATCGLINLLSHYLQEFLLKIAVFYLIVVSFVFYLYISLFDQILTTEVKEWIASLMDLFTYLFVAYVMTSVVLTVWR
jgi:hypothetical protein